MLSSAMCFVGRGGAKAVSMTFESRSSRHEETLIGQVLHSQLPVALRREIPAQYPCCVGSASQ